MEYISSYYWQKGENASSLLLKQCCYRDVPVLFACVCAGAGSREGIAGGYLMKRLSDWFCGLKLKSAARDGDRFLNRLVLRLEDLIAEADRELAEAGLEADADLGRKAQLGGMLCIGQECLLFGRGDVQIRLLNRNMGRPSGELLVGGQDELCVRRAVMESDIGVLAATGFFCRGLQKLTLDAGLYAGEVLTERQAEGHLRELGEAGERAGGRNMAAVLFYVVRQ